ncbi:hypothetical protein [Cellulomonas hominis]
MICDPLATTGANLGLLVLTAIVLLVVGTLVLVTARSRRAGSSAALLVLLLVGAGVVVAPGVPAQAATSDCVTTEGSLTVVQTSTMAGLAPGVAPVAITGLVTNTGTDRTVIGAVDVAITSVTRAAGSAGPCDPSDYVLLDTRMPVGQTLEPGASVPFAGASIGFSDKTTNQDACQGASIQLRYTVVPGAQPR